MEHPDDYARPAIVERIIERPNGNGGFGRLKDFILGAVLLGAGTMIWAQQTSINDMQRDIAVLKVKCEDQPLMRGR